MTFGHPLLLLTLLLIPAAVGLWVLAERRRMRYAVRFTNLDVLAAVAAERRGVAWRRYVPPAVFLLALAAACVAFARPHVTHTVGTQRATVILVVDVSGSMQASDVKPTRLEAAQEAVRTFLDRVPKNLRVGLIAFAGEPQVAAPPTTDHQLVKESLDSIGMFPGYGGTAIGDALAAAVQLGESAVFGGAQTIADAPPRNVHGLVSILFLSDGSQTRGLLQPLEGAQQARTAGIPVYTVALGTPHGTLSRGFGAFTRSIPVPPDPQTLHQIANVTHGQFTDARDAATLQKAYAKLGSKIGRTRGRSEITFAFLAAAAGLFLGAGLLSALWSPRLP
ncbi:MAG: VWA domain-containing protein [Gaiellaceae bacterium]